MDAMLAVTVTVSATELVRVTVCSTAVSEACSVACDATADATAAAVQQQLIADAVQLQLAVAKRKPIDLAFTVRFAKLTL